MMQLLGDATEQVPWREIRAVMVERLQAAVDADQPGVRSHRYPALMAAALQPANEAGGGGGVDRLVAQDSSHHLQKLGSDARPARAARNDG